MWFGRLIDPQLLQLSLPRGLGANGTAVAQLPLRPSSTSRRLAERVSGEGPGQSDRGAGRRRRCTQGMLHGAGPALSPLAASAPAYRMERLPVQGKASCPRRRKRRRQNAAAERGTTLSSFRSRRAAAYVQLRRLATSVRRGVAQLRQPEPAAFAAGLPRGVDDSGEPRTRSAPRLHVQKAAFDRCGTGVSTGEQGIGVGIHS